MTIFLVLFYYVIGAAITFALNYLYQKSDRHFDDSCYCVMIGVFWPVAAPFAFAVYFAKELSRRK